MTTAAEQMLQAAPALEALARMREEHPLAFSRLWHNELPRTSQRAPLQRAGVDSVLAAGGNGSGKSKQLWDNVGIEHLTDGCIGETRVTDVRDPLTAACQQRVLIRHGCVGIVGNQLLEPFDRARKARHVLKPADGECLR